MGFADSLEPTQAEQQEIDLQPYISEHSHSLFL